MRHGPEFRWFAWHPVWTDDRGYRWLRLVWRRREHTPAGVMFGASWWAHSIRKWER